MEGSFEVVDVSPSTVSRSLGVKARLSFFDFNNFTTQYEYTSTKHIRPCSIIIYPSFVSREMAGRGRMETDVSRYGVYYIYHKNRWDIEVVEEEEEKKVS